MLLALVPVVVFGANLVARRTGRGPSTGKPAAQVDQGQLTGRSTDLVMRRRACAGPMTRMRPLAQPFEDIAAGRPAVIDLSRSRAPGQPPADQGSRVPAPTSARRSTCWACCRTGCSPSTSRWSWSSSTCGSRTTRWSATSGSPRSRTATRPCSTGCWQSTSRSSCPSSTRPPSGAPARSTATSSGAPGAPGSRPPTSTASRGCCARGPSAMCASSWSPTTSASWALATRARAAWPSPSASWRCTRRAAASTPA